MTRVKGKEGGVLGPNRRRKRCVGLKLRVGDEVLLERQWHVISEIRHDIHEMTTKRGSKEFKYFVLRDRLYDIIRKEISNAS